LPLGPLELLEPGLRLGFPLEPLLEPLAPLVQPLEPGRPDLPLGLEPLRLPVPVAERWFQAASCLP
jgi:hypothetical protein